MSVIKGSAVADTLNGTDGDDYISGLAANDTIDGGAGNDTMFGGTGDDNLIDGAGSDTMYGGDGADFFSMATDLKSDLLYGDVGTDIVGYEIPSTTTNVVDLLDNSKNSGAAAGDKLVGIEGYVGSGTKDIFRGSDGSDYFFASGGNDVFAGRDGIDQYIALPSAGSSQISKFELAFGNRAATLAASAGAAAPNDGQAVAYYEVWNDANNDQIRQTSEVSKYADVLAGVEFFVGTAGNEIMTGSAADEFFAPLNGKDTIDGGAGIDSLSYYSVGASDFGNVGVTVDLAGGTAITGLYDSTALTYVPTTSHVSHIENAFGSAFNDQLQGDGSANALLGRDGDDALDGRGGDDVIIGGNGDDMLVGRDGDDVLDGGAGADILAGGAGADTASYASAATPIAVSLLRTLQDFYPVVDDVPYPGAASEGDTLTGVENVIGSTFGDAITGDDGGNTIEGRAGNDEINACGGNDVIYGESAPNSPVEDYHPEPDLTDLSIIDDCNCDPDAQDHDVSDDFNDELHGADGNDQIYGQLGDDQLWGGLGTDTLAGGEGNDVLDGGAGNDSLDGGLGTDFMYGGTGNDLFSGSPGFDLLFGGDGTDTVSYASAPNAVNVDLSQFWQSGDDTSTDLLFSMMSDLSEGADPSILIFTAVFANLMQSLGSTGSDSSFTLGIPDVLIGIESVSGSRYNDTIRGNALANTLNGARGNDVIAGGDGNDTLTGGAGADIFLFDTRANSSSNSDRITDYSVAADTIRLSQSAFTALAVGSLSSDAFFTGTAAHDSNDRIIYDPASGKLFYDPDGNGGAGSIKIATLSSGLALTNLDVQVVAGPSGAAALSSPMMQFAASHAEVVTSATAASEVPTWHAAQLESASADGLLCLC